MGSFKVIIHAGFHKTGTTTIQKALKAHRDTWKPHVRVALRNDLGSLPWMLREWPRVPDDVTLDETRAAARDAFEAFDPADPRPLLISSEDLSGPMPGRGDVPSYDALPRIVPLLADAVRAQFGPEAEVTFLFTTREADRWMHSLWWQHVRIKRYAKPLEAFVQAYPDAARFDLVLKPARLAVPDCRFAVSQLEKIGDLPAGPVTPLLELAGLPRALWPEAAPPSNARPAVGLEPVFLALNQSGLPNGVIRDVKKTLMRKAKRQG